MSVLFVVKDMCGSELSEFLFCVCYKICEGRKVQSVCFVCGIKCMWE